MMLNKLVLSVNRITKALIRRGMFFIDRHPQSRRYLIVLIKNLGLDGIARSLYARYKPVIGYGGERSVISVDITDLTPRAHQIHDDLKAAIERRKKENS